jgi:hypothetical protein
VSVSQRVATRPALAVILILIAMFGAACGRSDDPTTEDSDAPADYAFSIPVGAGEALDRGEPLEILPRSLEVTVGETLEIVNLDDRGHLVGPFFVGAGETLRQRFASPGTFSGTCTVHPSGEIELVVTDD